MGLFKYITKITLLVGIVWVLVLGCWLYSAIKDNQTRGWYATPHDGSSFTHNNNIDTSIAITRLEQTEPNSPKIKELENKLNRLTFWESFVNLVKPVGEPLDKKLILICLCIIVMPIILFFFVFWGLANLFPKLFQLLHCDEPKFKILYLILLLMVIILAPLYIFTKLPDKYGIHMTLPFYKFEDLYRFNKSFNPPISTDPFWKVDDSYIKITGSFISETKYEFPIQTSEIHCSKDKQACLELRTIFLDGNPMPEKYLYHIYKWDENEVIAYDISSNCEYVLLKIDRKDQIVTSVLSPTPNQTSNCPLAKSIKSFLTDGYRTLEKYSNEVQLSMKPYSHEKSLSSKATETLQEKANRIARDDYEGITNDDIDAIYDPKNHINIPPKGSTGPVEKRHSSTASSKIYIDIQAPAISYEELQKFDQNRINEKCARQLGYVLADDGLKGATLLVRINSLDSKQPTVAVAKKFLSILNSADKKYLKEYSECLGALNSAGKEALLEERDAILGWTDEAKKFSKPTSR